MKCILSESTLDLDNYISNYEGHAKIDRLIYVGDKCTALRIEAYKAAIHVLMRSTVNLNLYNQLVAKLNHELAEQNIPQVDVDIEWISKTANYLNTKLERLESDLIGYKQNMIKESIRVP